MLSTVAYRSALVAPHTLAISIAAHASTHSPRAIVNARALSALVTRPAPRPRSTLHSAPRASLDRVDAHRSPSHREPRSRASLRRRTPGECAAVPIVESSSWLVSFALQ